MTQRWLDDAKSPTTSALQSSSRPILSHCTSHSSSRPSHGNVFRLLAWREISPRTRPSSKSLWGRTSKWRIDCFGPRCEIPDARHSLISWVEAESLRHLSAKYCPLLPPPRSTIAAAFSSDGKTLASTHGDHTVKIIECQTGSCLKVLIGHRRTPWVVRFHPLYPEILASGSLDHEVRLWDANTADCIGSRDFYRPIASIAFHAQGELLAVASGHKLYIWNYNRKGDRSSPNIVLKTRRSLRAVHFHPHAAPFLLTAEVSDLDSTDYPLTEATSPGYSQYPPTALFLANHSSSHQAAEAKVPLVPSSCLFWPTSVGEDGRTSLQHESGTVGSGNGQQRVESSLLNQRQPCPNIGSQCDNMMTPMEMSPGELSVTNAVPEEASADTLLFEMETTNADSIMDILESTEGQSTSGVLERGSSSIVENSDDISNIPLPIFQSNEVPIRIPVRQSRLGSELTPSIDASSTLVNADLQVLMRSVEAGQLHQLFPFGDPACWELPFLQGWLMGQTHAGLHAMLPLSNSLQGNSSLIRGMGSDILASELSSRNASLVTSSAAAAAAAAAASLGSRGIGRSAVRHRSRSRLMAPAGFGEGAAFLNVQIDGDSQSGASNIVSESATSLPATATAELPCTVKLRIWPHDIQNPCIPLDAETCRLTIPHAVLCSEMGTHFSPCGRFLAACVACVLPHMEVDPGLQSQMQHDATGAATSPTRHPTSARQLMYELRIYSLEEATFGMVLASRAIRAAHCLTSIQFSPTSEHILLAYGRRHSSLLRSIVIDGETTIPIYTILEVYRVSDMELVRVLPSAEDEVNVASFHPIAGGGLVYGTKEGKLRILHYDGPHGSNCNGSNILLEENMLEVQQYALEC